MFCGNCGSVCPDGSSTCPSCGSALPPTTVTPPNPYTANYGTSLNPPSEVAAGAKPGNQLVPAILVTLCCCLPTGIVAIVYAAQVDSKWRTGDYGGAIESSNKAKTWCWVSLGLGLLTNLAYLGINIAGVASQSMP